MCRELSDRNLVIPGLLGSHGIKWNSTKFLVDREGQVVEPPTPKPLRAAVERICDKHDGERTDETGPGYRL